MAEQKLIPTTTVVTTAPTGSPNIEVLTFYDPGYFHIISCFIADKVGSKLGVAYEEGDLVIILRDSPEQVVVSVNDQGELIITAPSGETYTINSDGDLIGTTNI